MIQYFVWYMPNGRITIVSEAVVFAVVSLAWRWVLSSIFRRAPKQAVAVYGTEAVCAEIDQILRAEAYCPFEVRYVVGGTFMEPSPSPETSLKLSARIERVAALEAEESVLAEVADVSCSLARDTEDGRSIEDRGPGSLRPPPRALIEYFRGFGHYGR